MPKENRKIVESSSGQRKVFRISSKEMARSVTDDVLQHTLYPTPVPPAPGEASALTGSKRRRLQEPEGAPYLANFPASVENRGSDTLFKEVWMYAFAS